MKLPNTSKFAVPVWQAFPQIIFWNNNTGLKNVLRHRKANQRKDFSFSQEFAETEFVFSGGTYWQHFLAT